MLLDPPPDEIIAGFPSDLFLLLAGVTYLFGVAQTNGTIDLLVNWMICAVRARAAALLWVFVFISALLSSIGALVAVAIVAPIAKLSVARDRNVTLRIEILVLGAGFSHRCAGGWIAAESWLPGRAALRAVLNSQCSNTSSERVR